MRDELRIAKKKKKGIIKKAREKSRHIRMELVVALDECRMC